MRHAVPTKKTFLKNSKVSSHKYMAVAKKAVKKAVKKVVAKKAVKKAVKKVVAKKRA